MKSTLGLGALLLGVVILGGCATSRSVLDISAPASDKVTTSSNGKYVYINTIIDKRVFEVSPSEPNIPSLNPSEDQSDQIKLRAVARKRNGFGKALGDMLLKEGQTVESLTAASIRQAFVEKGYRVIESKDKTNASTYIVDADIVKFWSWMNPGFLAISLSTEVSTGLTIKSPEGTNKQTISVKESDYYQTAMENNWVAVINMALRAYVDELKSKLK
jgi:uncharacterized lipoprotein YajG